MQSYMDRDGQDVGAKRQSNERRTPKETSRKKQKTKTRTSTIDSVDLTSDRDENDSGLLSFLDDEN